MAKDDLIFNDIGNNDDIIFDSKSKGFFKSVSYATSRLSAALTDVYDAIDEEAEIEESKVAASMLAGGSPLLAHFMEAGIDRYIPKLKKSVLILKNKAKDFIFKKKNLDELQSEFSKVEDELSEEEKSYQNELNSLTNRMEELDATGTKKSSKRKKTVTNKKVKRPISGKITKGMEKIGPKAEYDFQEMFQIRRNKLSDSPSFKKLVAKNNKFPFGDFIANQLEKISKNIDNVDKKLFKLNDMISDMVSLNIVKADAERKEKAKGNIKGKRVETSSEMLKSLDRIHKAILDLPVKQSTSEADNFEKIANDTKGRLTATSGLFIRQSIIKKGQKIPGMVIPDAKSGLISGAEFQGLMLTQAVQQLYWMSQSMGKLFGGKQQNLIGYIAQGFESAMQAVAMRTPIIRQLNMMFGFMEYIGKFMFKVLGYFALPITMLIPGKRLKYAKEVPLKGTPIESLVSVGLYQYNKLSMIYELLAKVHSKEAKGVSATELYSKIPGITPLVKGLIGTTKFLLGERKEKIEKEKKSGMLARMRESSKRFFIGSEKERSKAFSELSSQQKQMQIEYNMLKHLSSIDAHVIKIVKNIDPGASVKPQQYSDIADYVKAQGMEKTKRGASRLGGAIHTATKPFAKLGSMAARWMKKKREPEYEISGGGNYKKVLSDEEKANAEEAKIKRSVLKKSKDWLSKPSVIGGGVLLGASLLNPLAYIALNSIWGMGMLGSFTGVEEFKVFNDLYDETATSIGEQSKKIWNVVGDQKTPLTSKLQQSFNKLFQKKRKPNALSAIFGSSKRKVKEEATRLNNEEVKVEKQQLEEDKKSTTLLEKIKNFSRETNSKLGKLPKKITSAARVGMGVIGGFVVYKLMGGVKAVFGSTPMARSWLTISTGIAAYLATKDINAALNVLQVGVIGGGLLFIFEKLKPFLGTKGALATTAGIGIAAAVSGPAIIATKTLSTVGGWIKGALVGTGLGGSILSGLSTATAVALSPAGLIALTIGGSVAGLTYLLKKKHEEAAEREIKRAKQDAKENEALLDVNKTIVEQFGTQEGKTKIAQLAAKAGIRASGSLETMADELKGLEEKKSKAWFYKEARFGWKIDALKKVMSERTETAKSIKDFQTNLFSRLKEVKADVDIAGANKTFLNMLDELKENKDINKGTRKSINKLSDKLSSDIKKKGPISQWSEKDILETPAEKRYHLSEIAIYGAQLAAMGVDKNSILKFLDNAFFANKQSGKNTAEFKRSLTSSAAMALKGVSGKDVKFQERVPISSKWIQAAKDKYKGIKSKLGNTGVVKKLKSVKDRFAFESDKQQIQQAFEYHKKAEETKKKWFGTFRAHKYYVKENKTMNNLINDIIGQYKKGIMSRPEAAARMVSALYRARKMGYISDEDVNGFKHLFKRGVLRKLYGGNMNLMAMEMMSGKEKTFTDVIPDYKEGITEMQRMGMLPSKEELKNIKWKDVKTIGKAAFTKLKDETKYRTRNIAKTYEEYKSLSDKERKEGLLFIKQHGSKKLKAVAVGTEMARKGESAVRKAKEMFSGLFKDKETAKYERDQGVKESMGNAVTAIRANTTTVINQLKSSNTTTVSSNNSQEGQSSMDDIISAFNKMQGLLMQGEI